MQKILNSLCWSGASQSYQGWSTFSCKPLSLDISLETAVPSVCLLPSAHVFGIVPEVVTGVGVSVVSIAVTVTIMVEVEALVASVSLKTVDMSAGESLSIFGTARPIGLYSAITCVFLSVLIC